MGTWRLGALGSLTEIPPPADPTDVAHDLVGGEHVSLGGVATVDRAAWARSWQMEWPALDEDQAAYLEAVGLGLVPGPLRLLNPQRRNRLHQQVASGGSLRRSTERWETVGGGTVAWAATPAPVPVRGALTWGIPDSIGTDVYLASGNTSVVNRVPLVPGETVRISCWARRDAVAASVRVGAGIHDTAGAVASTVDGTVTALTTTWAQLSVTYAVPGDGSRISLAPYLRAGSQPATTVRATGWQAALATDPTAWTPGGGAPVVVASALRQTYHLYLAGVTHGWQMTLREAA